MRRHGLALLTGALAVLLALPACMVHRKLPTISFIQYELPSGAQHRQRKSNIEIELTIIRISDVYQYPNLFGFDLEDYPQYKDSSLDILYPIGPLDKRWLNPFSTPDATEQLLLCRVRLHNGTNHILRMRDARVYLIIEGQEPMPAFSRFSDLLDAAVYFEKHVAQYVANNPVASLGGIVSFTIEWPAGFFKEFVLYHKNDFSLINDVRKEILPDFTYEGMLVFPAVPTKYSAARISFFDITTKTDPAGNPVQKTQFHFDLEPHQVEMWYDKTERMWKLGAPTTAAASGQTAPEHRHNPQDTIAPPPSHVERPADTPRNGPQREGRTEEARHPISPHMYGDEGMRVTARVSVSVANMRSGPGTDFEIAGRATHGDVLTVVARDPSAQWYLVEKASGQRAWVYATLVSLSPEGATVPEWRQP